MCRKLHLILTLYFTWPSTLVFTLPCKGPQTLKGPDTKYFRFFRLGGLSQLLTNSAIVRK
jgi:hypothetical protein